MIYDENRNKRCKQANEHTARMKYKYGIETKRSIKNSEIVKFEGVAFPPIKTASKIIGFIFPFLKTTPKIIIEETDSVNSIINHAINGKVAILNFASYKHPGGGFIVGGHAQEECLCHASNLYNILSAFTDSFYLHNRADLNDGLYYSRGIYSPNVIFIKDSKKVECDVITVACPNRGSHLKHHNGTEDRNLIALEERIEFVLETAAKHNVKTLLLGLMVVGYLSKNPKL